MDLFILTADKNVEFALKGALPRYQALGIRPISFDVRSHSGRDGGMRATGADILALEAPFHGSTLMVFDYEGCGAGNESALDLEARLDNELSMKIPGGRSKAIVIEPECDIWMWGSDNVLSQILQWPLDVDIRPWLRAHGFEFDQNDKPVRPKEALDAMRKIHRKPRSSALYQKIAAAISLNRCADPAFIRLRNVLQNWFP